MIFTLVFAVWTLVLILAWQAPRPVGVASTLIALVLTLALFVHHITDPLRLSF